MSKEVQKKLKERQAAAADHYNKTAQSKAALVRGQPVRLYDNDKRRWEPAIVTGHAATPRSYIVQRMSGGMPLRRNRVQLRPTREYFGDMRAPSVEDEEEEEVESVPARSLPSESFISIPVVPNNGGANNNKEAVTSSSTQPAMRRSNRMRKQTDFYGCTSEK